MDAAGRDVDPIVWLGVDPSVTVEDGDAAFQGVERLGDRAMEVGVRTPLPAPISQR